MDFEKIKVTLINFIKEQTKNIGTNKIIIGLSGGLDSTLVAFLAKEALGEDNVIGILMPSQFSNPQNIKDAKEICKILNIKYDIIPITPLLEAYNNFDEDKLRIGNFSARMRMAILYDQSAKYNAIVVGTGNKSEVLLGYGTIYGDTACAINPLGELYKSDEFEFAKFLGVPDFIIEKKPSADLWSGQSDEDELGYTYKELDIVLKDIFDRKIDKEILYKKYSKDIVDFCINRYEKNKFKSQMPPIAKLGLYYDNKE